MEVVRGELFTPENFNTNPDWVAQGAGGIAGVIRFINGSKGRMTQLKHEVAASTSRFRQGYQDETVLLSMVLEGDRNDTTDGVFVWQAEQPSNRAPFDIKHHIASGMENT